MARLAIEVDQQYIGHCSLSGLRDPHGDLERGILIGDRECWSRGYGREVVRVLLSYGLQALGARRIALTTHEDNPRAIRCHAACGFVEEGRPRQAFWTGRRYADLVEMSILRDEWSAAGPVGLPMVTDIPTGAATGITGRVGGRINVGGGARVDRTARPVRGHDEVVAIELETGEGDRDLAARLDTEIYAYNADTTGLRDGRLLTVRAASDGVLVAGLSGWTWGACGFVDALWVEAGARGRGLGTSLMDAAEQEMALRGCRQVVLMTHSFQAPDFYRRRGYTRVADVPDYPAGYAWILFRKPL